MDLLAHPAPAVAKPSEVYAPTIDGCHRAARLSGDDSGFRRSPLYSPRLRFRQTAARERSVLCVLSAVAVRHRPKSAPGAREVAIGLSSDRADVRQFGGTVKGFPGISSPWSPNITWQMVGKFWRPAEGPADATFPLQIQAHTHPFCMAFRAHRCATLDGHICNERHIIVRLNLRKAFLIWLLSVISTLHFATVWRWRARSVARSVVASVDNCWRRCRVLMVRVYGLVGAGVELRLEPAPPERVSARFAAQVSMEKPHPRHGVARPAP